jgi:hypothetical protein
MSSTDDLLKEVDSGTARESARDERSEESTSGRRGLRSRLGRLVPAPSLGGLFSLRSFLVAVVLSVGGMLAASLVPFLPGVVASLLGILLAGFLVGVGREQRAYLETGLAGAGVAGVATLLDYLLLSVVGNVGVPMAAIGGGAGFLAGLLGHYLGRDLRAGLTREV